MRSKKDFSFTSDLFQGPHKITRDRNGNSYVLDKAEAEIFKFDSTGDFLESIGEGKRGEIQLVKQDNFLISGECLIGNETKQKRRLFLNLGKYTKRIKLTGFNDFDMDNQGRVYGVKLISN